MSIEKSSQARYEIGKVSSEQFIPEHTMLFVIKGIIQVYDGSKTYTFKAGEYGIARKNRLARYKKERVSDEIEKVFVFFDEEFLKKFQATHKPTFKTLNTTETILKLNSSELIPFFIQSLKPYYNQGEIKEPFANVKREELLLILLQHQPELAGLFFDFGIPQKIDLEAFMNRNYTFNASNAQLAYLTGRSLSAFKRDFKKTFKETPNRWLVRKRLQEAHFLIEKKNKKPSEIYLDLGFEDLSHFSFAFKKQFGYAPTRFSE